MHYNVTGNNRTNVNSHGAGLVASWMWFFQRSDVGFTKYNGLIILIGLLNELPYKGITNACLE